MNLDHDRPVWTDGTGPARPDAAERDRYEPAAEQEQFIVPLLDHRIREILEEAPARSGARVLDVGCGERPFAAVLESLGYAYVGLDVTQNRSGTVDFICSIEGPLADALHGQNFELVVCLEVLEHVAKWEDAFANLARLLAPGGSLLVTCPAFYPLHEEPYDFWRPTPHALVRYGEGAGLTVRSIDRAGGPWEVLGTFLAVVRPRPNRDSVRGKTAAGVLRLARRLVFRALRSGSLQGLVRLDGPWYLSNVIRYDKQGDSR